MNQDISLWTPVVEGSLTTPHICRKECNVAVGRSCQRIEDIKVRILNMQTEQHGKHLETIIRLETVVLLEDYDGRTVLVSRPDTIQERLSFAEFDRTPPATEQEIGYITKMKELHWDGDQQAENVIINYCLSYMVFAVREQMVRLYAENELKDMGTEPDQALQVPEWETAPLERTNEALRHRLFLYEKDILGLRRAIKKTEERNAMLSRELSGVQKLVQTLRDAVTRKDLLICQYENQGRTAEDKYFPGISGLEPKLGQRLKRMFMGSL